MSDVQNSYTHRSKKDFTLIQNNLIRSASLSCKAFKLLCVGLSHSGGWVFRKSQIAACFKEGIHTVDEGMKELRSLGYLHLRAKKKENNDFAGHEWFWFEKPVSAEEFKLFLGDGAFQGFRDSGGSEDPGDIRRPIPKKTKLKKEEVSNVNARESAVKSISVKTPQDDELLIDDTMLYQKIISTKVDWKPEEVLYAWKALEDYEGEVYNWWEFLVGTVKKDRQVKRVQRERISMDSAHKSKSKRSGSCKTKLPNISKNYNKHSSENATLARPLESLASLLEFPRGFRLGSI